MPWLALYAPAVEPTEGDGPPTTSGARWWVPWAVSFLVSATALVALTTVFPVATAALAGFGSMVGAAWRGRGRVRDRATAGHWAAGGLAALLFIGIALLLGAAGLSIDDDHRDNALPGAVVGGILLVAGSVAFLWMFLAVRRRH